ncbi:hypothetical protein L798_14867 [Zootermopsis nevadensis]|uniref:Uncharacterized protein n=1 Tax=Zootermopsis nevadensis TaxID=136037 RepID=A0A067R1B2_ZOONE|nr:hypothetical protein L798_14867 [Zootermopsis nevadensis]
MDMAFSFPCRHQDSSHQTAVPIVTETLLNRATALNLRRFQTAALLLASRILRAAKGHLHRHRTPGLLPVLQSPRPHEMATTTVPHKKSDAEDIVRLGLNMNSFLSSAPTSRVHSLLYSVTYKGIMT